MRFKELLSQQQFIYRKKDKRWIDPKDNKGYTKDSALRKASKREGFKDYKDLQSTTRTLKYKKFAGWREKATGEKPDAKFNKLYKKAKDNKFKRGKGITELLRATTFNSDVIQDIDRESWLRNYL